MRWESKALSILALMFMFGCGVDNDSNNSIEKLYVSVATGDNTNVGTEKYPFKTLTHALTQVTNTYNIDYTIYLDEGNYTQESGEIFPIEIVHSVSIKKMKKAKKRPRIQGFGVYKKGHYNEKNITLLLNSGSLIDSINIEGNISANTTNLYTNGSNINISNLNSTEGGIGIYVSSYDSVVIDDCYLSSNAYGIKTEKTASIELRDTWVNYNKIGFYLKSNTFISSGSRIRANYQCDFIYDNISDTPHVEGVLWDTNILHLETTTECENGNDMVIINDGNIPYQVKLKVNTPLFKEIPKVQIVTPSFGELVSSNKPFIEITPTNHKFFKIGIFKNMPNVKNNEITNADDIVWTWDSSNVAESTVHYISFSDGKGYLTQGQQYYIALWGWDDDGLKINLSSNISYFVVDNY